MRKFNILLSLATFFLGITMMVFGVFASTGAITYSISGQINYEINEALVKMTTYVYYSGRLSEDTLTTTAIEEKITSLGLLDLDITTTEPTGLTKDTTRSHTFNALTDTSSPTFNLNNISFTNTIQIYYMVIRIENLVVSGTAANVYAIPSVGTAGDNIFAYASAKVPEIKKGSPKNLVLVVGAKDVAEISSANYSFGITLDIGTMPISFSIDGTTISSTYGTTWATYISGKSAYSTKTESGIVYVTNTSGDILKKGGVKVKTTDTIVDGAEYSFSAVTLINSDTYWYVELGQLSDGTAIQWELVSLDGSTKYTYSSSTPSVGTGSIFVQKTYTTESVFNNSTSDGNTYNGSVIQTYLKGLETFGDSNAYGITSDPGYIASYTTTDGGTVSGDKFWLLSLSQADTFFADKASRVFSNGTSSISWWLRTPVTNSSSSAKSVYADGNISSDYGMTYSRAVRAAFQLA